MRKIILTIIGLLLIAGAVIIARRLIANKKDPVPVEQKTTTTVFVRAVKNRPVPIAIKTNGTLQPQNRIDLSAEVQGIFETSDHPFKPGSYFSKGQTLLRINSDEFKANIMAQKSNLFNQLVKLLPDLKLDYPGAFPNWQEYAQNFDESQPLPPLPLPVGEKEKLFITGRGIYSTFYSIKNMEERLAKYRIQAPFSGILTETNVNPGAVVGPGQKLGEFISTGSYELPVAVNVQYMHLLKTGHSVKLSNLEKTKTWTGKIIRINGKVDQNSQTIKAYIGVSDNDLKAGMYIEAELQAKEIPSAFEISRQLLLDNNHVYIIRDSVLDTRPVTPVFFKEKTIIVTGLLNGDLLLAKPIPGAYKGMRVSINTQ